MFTGATWVEPAHDFESIVSAIAQSTTGDNALIENSWIWVHYYLYTVWYDNYMRTVLSRSVNRVSIEAKTHQTPTTSKTMWLGKNWEWETHGVSIFELRLVWVLKPNLFGCSIGICSDEDLMVDWCQCWVLYWDLWWLSGPGACAYIGGDWELVPELIFCLVYDLILYEPCIGVELLRADCWIVSDI